jgi:hypothetical protein
MKMSRLFVGILFCIFLVAPAAAQRRQTDRDADGMKGQVKLVVAEDAKLSSESGRPVEGKRVPAWTREYDAAGNFVREVFKARDGGVGFTMTYKFIDGDKTSLTEYERKLPVPVAVPSIAGSGRADARTRDPRFDMRYKDTFDARGNRVEQTSYLSSGELWVRDVSTFDAKGREVAWARYGKDGKVSSSKKTVYNKDGQEAEVTYFDHDGSVSEKYSYTGYKLDAMGNWVKRVAAKLVTKGGKSYFEPYQVTYRELTYY